DVLIIPGNGVFLGLSTATLVKPGITDRSVVNQHLAGRFFNGPFRRRRKGLGDSLVALAVVIAADIEILVCLPAIPADDLARLFDRPMARTSGLRIRFRVPHPTSRNDGMRLK